MIRNERDIQCGNIELILFEGTEGGEQTSWGYGGLRVLEAPSGVRGGVPEKEIVSKMKKKYNPPVDHQVSPPASVLGLRAIFR